LFFLSNGFINLKKMTAKRALNFGTPSSVKRRRLARRPMPRYRLSKPEMKAGDLTLSHSAATASNLELSAIAAGTADNNRIGNRVKAWRIQGRFVSQDPFRVEILMMNDASDSPSNTADQLYNYRTAVSFGTYVFPTEVANSVYDFDHKLPLGLNLTYNGTASTDITRNRLFARITSGTATTITGEMRIYFTDN